MIQSAVPDKSRRFAARCQEMEQARLAGRVSPEIPLHLSRFFPQYQMVDRLPMPVEQVYRLVEAARGYLSYVYTRNC